jgi:hypothetical protein
MTEFRDIKIITDLEQGTSREVRTQTTPQRTIDHGQCTQRRNRRPMSAEQRAKLSAAQLAYVANDPRWPEHRRKLAAAQEAKRMTLMENEVAAIVQMRKEGRNFSYVAERIGVCREVIGRELNALGISTAPVKPDRRMTLMENEVAAIVAMRKKGRSFEYIAEEIGVCRGVIKRELTALGISTAPVKPDRRARRGHGFWRCFDD